jgi:RNA polymerase sigma factor (sigma-70 family)
MANVTLQPAVAQDYIHRLARKWTNQDAGDADLLERFVSKQDESAFVLLLQRHARLVWDVCRRVHGKVHDAEDSFQATFFVFACTAGKIRSSTALARWLYRLAYRTAMHAKKNAYRRRLREERVAVPAGQVVPATGGLQELQAVLDDEVNRLAEKYRAPFVLCCLEGKSKSEAAAQLGWKDGTVSSRLAQARKLLQDRLTRRGCTLSALLTAGAVSEATSLAALPATLLNAAAQAAFQFALGKSPATAGSASAATLAGGVLKAMLWQKVNVVGAIILAVTFLGIGTAVVSYGAFNTRPAALQTEAKPNAPQEPEVAHKPPPHVDLYCDALPPGAIARMGTIQFRHSIGPSLVHYDMSDPTIDVAFSHDGQVIATGWEDRLRLWNANTGNFLSEIKTPDFTSGRQVFSPDGRFLAASFVGLAPQVGRVSYVGLWDAKTGKVRHRFPPEKGLQSDPNGVESHIWQVAFSPDSRLLALSEHKGTIQVWNTATGKQVRVLAPKSSTTGPFTCMAFTPDGKTLVAIASQARQIWHWDIGSGEVNKVVPVDIKEEQHGSWWLSGDGRTFTCLFFDQRNVRLLDTSTGKVRCQLEGEIAANLCRVAFTADGRLFATLSQRGGDEDKLIVSLWDTESGKLKHQFKIPSQRLGFMTFSPDGSRMTIGGWYTRLYDVASGKELLNKPAHRGNVSSLVFTPDGSTLLSGAHDGLIGIWDVATGKSRHFIQATRWNVQGLALVPGGSSFVSCGTDGMMGLYDWRTGQEIRRSASTRRRRSNSKK